MAMRRIPEARVKMASVASQEERQPRSRGVWASIITASVLILPN